MNDDGYFGKVVALADGVVAGQGPRMRWMWGEALLGYALTELDAELNEEPDAPPRSGRDAGRTAEPAESPYSAFAKSYCDWFMEHEPRVDQSDTAAPALVTWAMQKRFPESGYGKLTDRVVEYLRNEPRLVGEAINHLGHSPESRLYPKSVWVDSLMMSGVFAARYARESSDRELLEFASRQPRLYAKLLQDPETGLWHHSYWTARGRPHPGKGIFWARGNGWALASLPMILDQLPTGHPEAEGIAGIFTRTARALLVRQRDDGWFDTLLQDPGGSYRESSATALVAAGWMHGLRLGLLDNRFREPALSAFRSIVDALEQCPDGRLAMTEISGPTIPLPVFPRAGYRFIPVGKNIPYGVAALILAAIGYRRLVGASA